MPPARCTFLTPTGTCLQIQLSWEKISRWFRAGVRSFVFLALDRSKVGRHAFAVHRVFAEEMCGVHRASPRVLLFNVGALSPFWRKQPPRNESNHQLAVFEVRNVSWQQGEQKQMLARTTYQVRALVHHQDERKLSEKYIRG